MVSPQVVDLFFKDGAPEVLTNKLHNIQVIFETGAVFCKPFDQTLSNSEAHSF